MATFIAVTHAKKLFRVTEKDIEGLEHVSVPNPYYPTSSPMRLYDIRDVVRVAVEKRVARMDVDKAVARDLVRGYAPVRISHGACALSQDVLNIVMEKVAEGYTEGDLRDARVVMQELMLAGLVCKDFHLASAHGMCRLGNLIHSNNCILPACGINWDAYVRCPQSFKLKECRTAAQALNIKVGGTKAQVIVRTLAHFCMSVPKNVPARLLLHMKHYQEIDNAILKHMISVVKTAGIENACTVNAASRNLRFFASQAYGTFARVEQAYEAAKTALRNEKQGHAALRKHCKNRMCKQCCRQVGDSGCGVHARLQK